MRVLIVLLLLAGCHKEEPGKTDAPAKAAKPSPCQKLQAYPDLPEGKTPETCDEELAKVEKKDPKMHGCLARCVDESATYKDFEGCRRSCKRTKSEHVDVDQAQKIPPAAVCDAFNKLQSIYEHPPEAGVATCVGELTKMRDTDLSRYACVVECVNRKDADFKVATACRDACK